MKKMICFSNFASIRTKGGVEQMDLGFFPFQGG